MLPENPSFLVRGDDGQEYGPVDLTELRDWVQENRAGLGTEVRRDEPGASWQPWQNYPELVALLAEVNVTNGGTGMLPASVAPMWRRVLAFGLDLVLVSILLTPLLLMLCKIFLPDWLHLYRLAVENPPALPPDLPRTAEIIANLIADVVMALYFSLFQSLHGRTPAKSIFRIRVVDEMGQNPTFVQAFWRALLLIISMNLAFIPMLYAFFNPQRRALHDIMVGTYVVEA
jgi:uncharacterized RDD family membrane protein YckC